MRRAVTALGLLFLLAVQVHAHAQPAAGGAPLPAPPNPQKKSASSTNTAAAPPAATPPGAATSPGTATGNSPGATPPGEYYVEPPPTAGPSDSPPPPPAVPEAPPGPPPSAPTPIAGGAVYEPPPPEFYPEAEGVFEPPPPQARASHHIAPGTALWLGVRAGLFIPFGNLWARGSSDGQVVTLKGVPWRDYASVGPMFELNLGARIARNYNLFALWERAQLGAGSGDPGSPTAGKAAHGETDFWGVGIRATSDPDGIGFVTELALGYRRARSTWDDGTELQMTDAPFEARLGLGAEIRVNQYLTLSPLLAIGVGSFGKVERRSAQTLSDATSSLDQADGHAWATLTLGGFFDLFGSPR